MNITDILLNENSKIASQYFYDFCKEDLNYIPLMKLLLNPELKDKLNSEVLINGLISSIDNNREKYISAILKYMDKNGIELQSNNITDHLLLYIENNNHNAVSIIFNYIKEHDYFKQYDIKDMQILFNCARKNNNIDFAQQLDQHYFLIEKSMNQIMGDYIKLNLNGITQIKPDGSLSLGGAASPGMLESDIEEKKKEYSYHPIIYALNNFNIKALDSYFQPNYAISPSLLTHAFVNVVWNNNYEAVDFLLSNKQCSKIIKHNADIQKFLHSEVDCPDIKKHIQRYFFHEKLQESIAEDFSDHKKIKI